MATFISTIKFTPEGIKGIDRSTKRAAELKAFAKKLKVKVKDVYWTMGEHDGALIFEAADDETATTLLLHLEAEGCVHTSTARAFTAAEMDKIVAKVHAG
ncbi:MAG: GYD domain-containing protein [Planctomycetota bacterium]|nr:GYD domain-containing protein [Planctomycetota bacterium]